MIVLIKRNKSQLDINFLINCKTFGVFPKFIYVNIRNIDEYDTLCLKKKLRNNAIHKRIRERNTFDKNIRNIERIIKSKLNTIDWLIIRKLLLRNIKNSEQSYIKIYEKKLRNLTSHNLSIALMRSELSHLNEHKFNHNFDDCVN